MAGGMRRGGLGSMADRLSHTRQPPPPSLKHCWVQGRHGRLPGLLLGWEQRADGWYGRVVHPELDAEGWAVVEAWLPAQLLEPAPGTERPR